MVSLGKATTGVMWKWVIRITIMNNRFNTFSAVIRSREVEPLFVVLDGVSLFIIRQSKCSPMLSIALSHSHSPLTYTQMVVPDRIFRKDEDSVCPNLSYKHQFWLLLFRYWFTVITWSDGSDDGGNIVDSDNMMQQRTSQMRGDGEDFRDRLQGSSIKMANK